MHAELIRILHEYASRRGRLGLLKLFGKGLRLVVHWPDHRAWVRVVGGPVTGSLLVRTPRMRFRPAAQYLYQGTDYRTRMRFLRTHYAFLNARCAATRFERVLQPAGLRLWQRAAEGHEIEIRLHGPPHHHEGDLGLVVLCDRVAIFRLSFSIVPARHFFAHDHSARSNGHALYIGQVQGSSGHAEAIRLATRCCEAIAPQDLLMSAVAGIARGWGIDRLLAVSGARHLSAATMNAAPHAFDYEAFWQRYQSELGPDGHHAIALPFLQKPLHGIVARHRKRTTRKRRFKDALMHEVALRTVADLSAVPVGQS